LTPRFKTLALLLVVLFIGGIGGEAFATISSSPVSYVSPYECEKGVSYVIGVDSAGSPNYYGIATSGTSANSCGTLAYSTNCGTYIGCTTEASAVAVINAVTQAVATANGGTVYFECGVYVLSAMIELYEGVNLLGCGQGYTPTTNGAVLETNGNFPCINITRSPASASHPLLTTISQLFLEGTNNVADTSNNGIYEKNSQTFDLYIDHTVMTLFYNGLYISSGSKTRVTESTIEGNLNYGIDSVQNYFEYFGDDYIRSNAAYGYYGFANMLQLIGNQFILNGGGGAEITSYGLHQNTMIVNGNLFDSNCVSSCPGGTADLRMDGSSANVTVVANTFNAYDTYEPNHDLYISNQATATVEGNVFMASSSNAANVVSTNAAAKQDSTFLDNTGVNPWGELTTSFLIGGRSSVTYHLIEPSGFGANSTTEIASTTYQMAYFGCFVTSANSSNSNNAILIKDPSGNTMLGPVGTLTAVFVPAEYTITWGAFTGTAGAATVFCN
jgi:hypothetical protein